MTVCLFLLEPRARERTPRTCKENSQGRDPSTLEINSQGEVPTAPFKGRNHHAKRWRVQKKRKEVRWKKKKVKHRKRRWWTKCEESIASLFTLRKREAAKEQENRKEARRPKVGQTVRKTERWLLLLWLLRQSGLGVSAAAEGPQKRTEAMERIQQELQVKGGQMGGGDFTKVEAARRRDRS